MPGEIMLTHTFAHTPAPVLVEAETALAELLDPLALMVAAGDVQPSLYAELAQLKSQMAAAVEHKAARSKGRR